MPLSATSSSTQSLSSESRTCDPTTGLGVLDRVGHQVVDDLGHPLGVDAHRELLGHGEVEVEAGRSGRRTRGLDGLLDDRAEVADGEVDRHRGAVALGGVEEVGDQPAEAFGVAVHHAQLLDRVRRERLVLLEELDVADDRRERRTQLVGDQGDELVLDPERAHEVGDVGVAEGCAGEGTLLGPHGPGRHRQRSSLRRVGADPHPDVVELLAEAGAVGRHLLADQGSPAVDVVDLAELSGPARMALGEAELHELGVPAVHAGVLPGAVEEHQADVDGVEDRLGDPALVLDRVQGARQLAVPAPSLLHAGRDHERGDDRDHRDQERAGRDDGVVADVDQSRHGDQTEAGDPGDDRPDATVLAPQPQRGDHDEQSVAALVAEPGGSDDGDVEHRQHHRRPGMQPRPRSQGGDQEGRDRQERRDPGPRGPREAEAEGDPDADVEQVERREADLETPRVGHRHRPAMPAAARLISSEPRHPSSLLAGQHSASRDRPSGRSSPYLVVAVVEEVAQQPSRNPVAPVWLRRKDEVALSVETPAACRPPWLGRRQAFTGYGALAVAVRSRLSGPLPGG